MSNDKNRNNTEPPNKNTIQNKIIKKDPSNNIIINPCFSTLHDCNNKKNHVWFSDQSLNGTDNTFNKQFNMILEELRRNRYTNKRKTKNIYNKVTDDLEKKNLQLTTIDNRKKLNLEQFLNDITKKYNLIYDENDKTDKNKIVTKWGTNYRPRRNSIWVPNKNDKLSLDLSNIPIKSIKLPPPPLMFEKTKVVINREINGLNDLLKLIDDYPLKYDVEYNIDMKALHNVNEPLRNLNSMIGMNKLKDSIVDQIIYFLQGLDNNNDFMHTVIYGPPGTGKTEVAKIMGSIFSSIGILNKNTFKKVTRADLIAGYLGQTAMKTKDVINGSLGGVLFIDEAYALGNDEKKDSFAKECIDTLCESLSDHKSNIMVIIAGYEEDLKKCFFAYNQGLNSRFPWRFHTDDYTANELKQIFVKKVNDINWTIKTPVTDDWFECKKEYFKYYGRDMETLLAKTKIAHGRRVFCKPKNEKTIITQEDLDKGFKIFLSNNEVKERKPSECIVPFMYI